MRSSQGRRFPRPGRRSCIAMPRNPGYTDDMDAKTRYRRHLKLQAALTRVMEVLVRNEAAGIPPDRTTSLMAWQVYVKLMAFIKASGLAPAELPVHTDLARFV